MKQNKLTNSADYFLKYDPPLGGVPDSSLRIGIEFEVGGCYEDWGFVVEQKVYEGDSLKLKRISEGSTLEEAIRKARIILKARFAKSSAKKCFYCNFKEPVGFFEEFGEEYPICMDCMVR